MSIISVTTYGSDPQTVNAANLNALVTPIITDYNGNIDNTNIATSAGIANSKLNLTSIAQAITATGGLTVSTVAQTMTSIAINEAKGGDLASGSTVNIGAATGNYVHITGTTTITAFDTVQSGTRRILEFDGILTLTHNGTSLILPTGANITTAAGDTATMVSEGSGNWRCTSYQRKDGTALSAGSGGTLGSYKNLAGVWASSSTVTYTADEIILENSSNVKTTVRSLSGTATSASNGAVNKLDVGTVAANTIYYIWAISDLATPGILISASSSAPTLPSGYTYKALIGCAATNNSSNFIKFHQYGKKYTFDTWALLVTGTSVSAWASFSTTPANMTTNAGFVPSAISTFCFGALCGYNIASKITNDNSVSTDPTVSTPNRLCQTNGNESTAYFQFDILTANTLYWGSGAGGYASVFLHGFEINKL